jgi:rubrerythrin
MAKKKKDLEKLYDKDPEIHKMHKFKIKWGPKKKRKRTTKVKDPYRQTPADVSFWWTCPECVHIHQEQWSYLDLATRGTPVCPICDSEMQLNVED